MKRPPLKRIFQAGICILVAILLLYAKAPKLPSIDQKADGYFTSAITKAGLAYATCRAVNASVSILKDSDLQLEPAGIGVSLAIGQVLDPIDDMTERLSNILVTAIASIGIQKLIYEISISVAPPLVAVLLLILSPLLLLSHTRMENLQTYITRVMILIIIARVCLPISAVINDYVYRQFFEEQITQARNNIATGSMGSNRLTDFSLPEFKGFMDAIENGAAFLKQKSIAFKNALAGTVRNAGNIIENLLKLTFLYAGIFVVQVIVLPILIFWFLAKAANAVFHNRIAESFD